MPIFSMQGDYTMNRENFDFLRENMQKEAICALTKKPVVTYSSERVRLWSEICEEVKDIENQPLKLGNALKAFLSRVSIPVSENDILIGRMVEESFNEDEEKAFREKYITPLMKNEGIPKFFFDAGHHRIGIGRRKQRKAQSRYNQRQYNEKQTCPFMNKYKDARSCRAEDHPKGRHLKR